MKFYVSFFLLFTTTLLFSQNGWILRNNGLPSNSWCDEIRKLDALNIWVVGADLIFRSTDGGLTWNNLNQYPDSNGIPNSSYGFWAFSLLNKNEALIATGIGNIYRTSNAGVKWTKVFDSSPNTFFFNDMEMFDDSLGYAIGDAPNSSLQPVFVTTTDGGKTWEKKTTNLPVGAFSSPRRADFINSKKGWSAMKSSVYKTIDGGSTWDKIVDVISLDRLFFMDDSIGFYTLVGGNTIAKSTDGGVTWNPKISLSKSFEFVRWSPAKKILWAGGNNFIYRSTDKGETWTQQSLPSNIPANMYFYDAFFLTDSIGVAAGRQGVLYTNNGGITSVTIPQKGSDAPPKRFNLFQNYPNPFNPSTTISFELPANGMVRLVVYDYFGREVTRLVNEQRSIGRYDVQFNAASFASGVYVCWLTSGNYTSIRKMLFLK